ncbi:MAG TPA: cytochrome c oxidase subunit II [Polyangia bacterium]|nr:cytochrome c oxidase subunit II [Polyangia bacterium]
MINEFLRRILFLPPQASTVARGIDWLHYFVISVTMAGATGITLTGAWLLIRYRARGPLRREDPTAKPPVWAEVMIVAGLLSLFCLWWVLGFAQYVRLQVSPPDALTVYVTGKQWMWKFAYPDGAHTISTLVVPTGRPVRLLLTSRDVIHSFYVPDFRIKQDAVPGRYTTTWFQVKQPGTHLVMCAEYCGLQHSQMRAQVIALSPEDYARWVGAAHRNAETDTPHLVADGDEGTVEEPPGLAGPRNDPPISVEEFPRAQAVDLVALGRTTAADLGCLRCHSLDGTAFIGPSWAGLYRSFVPLREGGPVLADEAYLTESMMDPTAKLHAGYQPVMPTYQGRLSPGQTAAILELIKSLRTPPPAAAPRDPAPALPVEVGGVPIVPAQPQGAAP